MINRSLCRCNLCHKRVKRVFGSDFPRVCTNPECKCFNVQLKLIGYKFADYVGANAKIHYYGVYGLEEESKNDIGYYCDETFPARKLKRRQRTKGKEKR